MSRRGQSTMELAFTIAVVSAALVAMSVYMKRAISGRYRSAADTVGEQYDPRRTTSDLVQTFRSTATTTSTLLIDQNVNGVTVNSMQHVTNIAPGGSVSDKTGTESIGAQPASPWQ
jgi:hypothetical protein